MVVICVFVVVSDGSYSYGGGSGRSWAVLDVLLVKLDVSVVVLARSGGGTKCFCGGSGWFWWWY